MRPGPHLPDNLNFIGWGYGMTVARLFRRAAAAKANLSILITAPWRRERLGAAIVIARDLPADGGPGR